MGQKRYEKIFELSHGALSAVRWVSGGIAVFSAILLLFFPTLVRTFTSYDFSQMSAIFYVNFGMLTMVSVIVFFVTNNGYYDKLEEWAAENYPEVTISKHSSWAFLKVFIFSGFGIFAFFISFNISEVTLSLFGYEFTYAGGDTFLVNHLSNFIRAMLSPVMRYVVFAIGILGVIDLYIRREKHFKSAVQTTFSVFKIIGFVILIFLVFNFGPNVLLEYNAGLGKSIGSFIMDSILIPITISLPCAALFLPFLLDYGLVDFVGVLVRPVMRPMFRLPGRAAVISISAFFGNFSVGHIAINDQYKSGKMTGREAAAIGTSLSTVSVGVLMVLATNTGIMEYWNIYFWSAFLVTLLCTLIGVRIFPLCKIPDTYMEGVAPDPELTYKSSLFKNAWLEAMEVADAAENPFKRIKALEIETALILGTVATGTAFFASLGVILNTYTPIFRWVGYIFYPFYWLLRLPAGELVTASTNTAISFLEVTLPTLAVAGDVAAWSLRLRYILSVVPVSSIIFLGSFVPCLMATEIPVKFWQMCVIWLERMIMSVFFAGILSLILF